MHSRRYALCKLKRLFGWQAENVAGNKNHGAEFEAQVRPHLDVLYRLAYRFTGSSDDAEDLVQELMMRLFRGSQNLSEIAELRPWLIKAMHNLFVDRWRHGQRTPFGHLHPEPWESLFDDAANSDTPEEETISLERRQQILQALYGLGKEHRALLVLHDMEGRDLPELAELLNIPLGTLKSRLFRARRRLRAALEDGNLLVDDDVIASKAEVSEYGL